MTSTEVRFLPTYLLVSRVKFVCVHDPSVVEQEESYKSTMSQCPKFSMDFGFHAIYRKVKHKKSTTGVFAGELYKFNKLYSDGDNNSNICVRVGGLIWRVKCNAVVAGLFDGDFVVVDDNEAIILSALYE